MAGGISLSESDAVFCEAIDVGRLVETAAVTSYVTPTQIIDQEEDNVGAICVCRTNDGWQQRRVDRGNARRRRPGVAPPRCTPVSRKAGKSAILPPGQLSRCCCSGG